MEFKTPTLGDKEFIDSFFEEESTRSCDFSTANIILWNQFYDCQYAVVCDTLVMRTDEEGESFSFPMGKGDKKKAVEEIMKYCEEQGIPFVMNGITHETEEQMKEMFGDIFQVEYNRDAADYIYEREQLATLRGKKLHGKRNHINRFKENHEWSYEKLTDENQLEALTMLMEWKMQNCTPEDLEKHEEICVSKNSLIYYKELGLAGGILRADGKIVGLSLGEPAVNPDTFVVHIEKAFPDIQGAYPMINQQFVLHEMEGFTYVNREEDMGEEGLRKAKMSYRPAFMLEKGFLRFRQEHKIVSK